MVIFPKGFKLPQGMNVAQAQKAMQATGECAHLVEMLLKDEQLGSMVQAFVSDHSSVFPILAESFEFQ